MNMTVRTIKTDAQTYSPAQKEQAQKCNVPIYLYPGAYAQRHGEIEEYRASRQANIACRDAIDAAIREHFRDNVLSKKAVQSVIGQYGFDRTMYVLAVTVLDTDGDGRMLDAMQDSVAHNESLVQNGRFRAEKTLAPYVDEKTAQSAKFEITERKKPQKTVDKSR